jgi:uncharacterized membrane protein (UPF0136 family)
MDINAALWLFPILFMVHNFEEIIMIQPWWRHDRNQSIRSPFVKIATYPQETVAALIGSIFFIFSVITAYAILSHNLIVGIGLALAFGLQLVGHVAEFVRVRRRYMPYILTSVLTLPYYPWLLVQALHAGFGVGELALATLGMGAIGLIILRLSHAVSGRISTLLTG